MSRSIRKGPHIDVKLLKKVDKMNEFNKERCYQRHGQDIL